MFYAEYNSYGVHTLGGSEFYAFDTKAERDTFVTKYELQGSNVVARACKRAFVERFVGKNFGFGVCHFTFDNANYVQLKYCTRRGNHVRTRG